jgi:hypothetical protein
VPLAGLVLALQVLQHKAWCRFYESVLAEIYGQKSKTVIKRL